ncbi:hypothetical protein HPULCUR_006796 [Helicostylum pulchrum]|uniref:F-box domain-containing protein n=1 Tax=Helicostylum pulchrum TaxID=562976 RepID=A0ABP9Y467_9FUNG
MNDLPAEVFYGIFRFLSRSEISTFSLVCKKWNSLVVKVYRKVLVIDGYKVRLAKLNLASDNRSQYFRNGHLVRKLIFKSERGGAMENYRGSSTEIHQRPLSFSRSEFLLLLEYLPNIEEINLTKSGNFTYYISFLLYANLQHIKKITALPFETYYGGYHEYFSTCFRFCGTLTSLCFQYTEAMNDYYYRSMDILDILSQFKNLKQLVFINRYRSELIMFQVQKLCPQLTELTFTSDVSSSEMVVQGSLDQRIEPTTVKLNKSLRHLNISLPSLSFTYTSYLASYLEDRLHTVNIEVTSNGLYDWLENVGMDVALKLMKKLGQSNNVCIFFLKSHDTQRAGLTSEMKMTRWFQLVNAFRGNKNALCTVKFCGTRSSQDYFTYNVLENQIILSYGLEYIDYHGREDGDHIYRFYRSLSEFALPIRSISIIGPEIIDRLELNLGRTADGFVMKFLRYAFINCINLQYLQVTDYLQIRACRNQRNNELKGIRNNLKAVHFPTSAPINNLIKVISTYLPDIEVLVLGSRNIFDLKLDLTVFTSLKRCYFIIQQAHSYRGSVTIRFNYTDGKKQRYYYDGTVQQILVRKDIQGDISNPRQIFIFDCEKDIKFTVCFGSEQSILEFDVDKLQGICYRIPTYLI